MNPNENTRPPRNTMTIINEHDDHIAINASIHARHPSIHRDEEISATKPLQLMCNQGNKETNAINDRP